MEITDFDRCDSCGHRAYMVATKVINGKEMPLYFCGHHGNKHRLMLDLSGWTVTDETSKLAVKS